MLQPTIDLGEIHAFGPFSPGSATAWSHEPTIHWGPDGHLAVVTMNHLPSGPGEKAAAIIVELGDEPTIREIATRSSLRAGRPQRR